MTAKTLVLGIGNTLLADEGVGVHVLQALAAELGERSDVALLDGGTLSFTLAGRIAESEALIVVDAANLRAVPGTWALLEGDEMDAFLDSNRHASVHEVGLADLRAIAILAGHWPEKRAMLAIQPHTVDWGDAPTAPVAAAIPAVCDAIVKQIGDWQRAA
jgi:hydrogenase maturation protease